MLGYWIGIDDKSIWQPSLTIGKLFIAQIRVMENALKLESGFVEQASDMFDINEDQLNVFITKLCEFQAGSHHAVLKNQLLPTVAIAIELLKRVNSGNLKKLFVSEEVLTTSAEVSRAMPS